MTTKSNLKRNNDGPAVKRIQLDGERAKRLRTLLQHSGKKPGIETSNAYIAALIDREWTLLDAMFQAQADELAEVE